MAWTVRSWLSALYVADVMATWSWIVKVFLATGLSPVLTTSIWVPAGILVFTAIRA